MSLCTHSFGKTFLIILIPNKLKTDGWGGKLLVKFPFFFFFKTLEYKL